MNAAKKKKKFFMPFNRYDVSLDCSCPDNHGAIHNSRKLMVMSAIDSVRDGKFCFQSLRQSEEVGQWLQSMPR